MTQGERGLERAVGGFTRTGWESETAGTARKERYVGWEGDGCGGL